MGTKPGQTKMKNMYVFEKEGRGFSAHFWGEKRKKIMSPLQV
jgi:hypothetical protein